eukprot:1949646-Pyramimonas_sp.AAC.1
MICDRKRDGWTDGRTLACAPVRGPSGNGAVAPWRQDTVVYALAQWQRGTPRGQTAASGAYT